MRFVIKPDDPSFNIMMETAQYQRLWKQYSRKIIKAFKDITGLDFQQDTVTARVYKGSVSSAGSPHLAMKLAGDNRTDEYKIATMVHELAHRLLGGNALGLVSLGLAKESLDWDDEHIELEHRHIYLFTYDVIEKAFGSELATAYKNYEERYGDNNKGHHLAWRWAMDMTFTERQNAVKILAANAVTRERWDDLDNKELTVRDPEAWFQSLKPR